MINKKTTMALFCIVNMKMKQKKNMDQFYLMMSTKDKNGSL